MSVTTRNNINGGYSHSSVLLSVLVAAVTLLIISSSCFEFTDAHVVGNEGNDALQMFSKLDKICLDCFDISGSQEDLFRCRQDDFKSIYFKGCVDTLQKSDEWETLQLYIKKLDVADTHYAYV